MAGGEDQATSSAFRVIAGGEAAQGESAWFCGYCGKPPRLSLPTPVARVCETCFVGVLLEAATDAVPGRAPFMVVDSALRILAVSDRAERLLGVYEQDANGRHVFDFLLNAEADAGADTDTDADATPAADNFAVAISAAAGTVVPIRHAEVRLREQPEVSARLRIATCGPPRAALVVFAEYSDGGPPMELARG